VASEVVGRARVALVIRERRMGRVRYMFSVEQDCLMSGSLWLCESSIVGLNSGRNYSWILVVLRYVERGQAFLYRQRVKSHEIVKQGGVLWTMKSNKEVQYSHSFATKGVLACSNLLRLCTNEVIVGLRKHIELYLSGHSCTRTASVRALPRSQESWSLGDARSFLTPP